MTAKKSAAPKKAAPKPRAPAKPKAQDSAARPDPAVSGQPHVVAAHAVAPASQMVKVKHVATGRVFAAWPVDARELVTHPAQDHVYADADDELSPQGIAALFPPRTGPADDTEPTLIDPVAQIETPVAAGAQLSASDAKAALEDKSKAELQDLAVRVGEDPNRSKAELVKALEPHAEAGTLSLSPPTGLLGKPAKERA
jgi:hypothetical protein